MHSAFLIVSTSEIISKLPTGEDGEITVPCTTKRRWVETQYIGWSRVECTENSYSEHEDEKQRYDQARNELTLIAQKAVWLFEQYITNYECVAAEIFSFKMDQQHFLIDLLPPTSPILIAD